MPGSAVGIGVLNSMPAGVAVGTGVGVEVGVAVAVGVTGGVGVGICKLSAGGASKERGSCSHRV